MTTRAVQDCCNQNILQHVLIKMLNHITQKTFFFFFLNESRNDTVKPVAHIYVDQVASISALSFAWTSAPVNEAFRSDNATDTQYDLLAQFFSLHWELVRWCGLRASSRGRMTCMWHHSHLVIGLGVQWFYHGWTFLEGSCGDLFDSCICGGQRKFTFFWD